MYDDEVRECSQLNSVFALHQFGRNLILTQRNFFGSKNK